MPNALQIVRFWSRQLSEHALFFHLGLEEADLKEASLDVHHAWEKFRKTIPGRAGESETDEVVARYLEMTRDLRAMKIHVLKRLNDGEWLGWIYPSFADHVRRELDYSVNLLTDNLGGGEKRARTELCGWLQFMAEHAAFADHLLDADERELMQEVTEIQGNLEELHGRCRSITPQLIDMSQKAGKALDRYFTNLDANITKVNSIIHPVLALHVVREGRMFLQTLEEMQGADKMVVEIPE